MGCRGGLWWWSGGADGSAVDDDVGADDARRRIRCQKRDDVGDLIWSGEATQRHAVPRVPPVTIARGDAAEAEAAPDVVASIFAVMWLLD